MNTADRVNAAYAENQPHDCNTAIRDAGPDAMRDPPEGEWTETDEDLDESFRVNDPSGRYYEILLYIQTAAIGQSKRLEIQMKPY